MNIKTLHMYRDTYGSTAGKVTGKIEFESEYGEVSLILTPEHCEQILRICADSLVQVSKEVATELTREVIEQDKPMLEDGSALVQ